MAEAEQYELLKQWGYEPSEASRLSGYIPTASNDAPDPAAHRQHVDRLKYNMWFDDNLEADRLEAEGKSVEAEMYRSGVNDIDAMYEAVNIGGSIVIRRTEAWGRLSVEDAEQDDDDDTPMIVTEADLDAIYAELHPDAPEDSSNDADDDSGVVAVGNEHPMIHPRNRERIAS